MSWKLFIDDERFPNDNSFIIARSTDEAIALVNEKGMPEHIAFDHDLGGDDTSIKFIWWFIYKFTDEEITIPDNFTFSVHSQNPIGAENIKGLMNSFLSSEVQLENRYTK